MKEKPENTNPFEEKEQSLEEEVKDAKKLVPNPFINDGLTRNYVLTSTHCLVCATPLFPPEGTVQHYCSKACRSNRHRRR